MNKDDGSRVDGRNYDYDVDYEGSDRPNQEITTESAERCLAFLRDTAEPHAAWAARRRFLEKHLSVILAIEIGKIGSGPKGERDTTAKKSIPYQKALRDLEEAVYHETLIESLRHAADKKFSGWQTLNANLRTGVNL